MAFCFVAVGCPAEEEGDTAGATEAGDSSGAPPADGGTPPMVTGASSSEGGSAEDTTAGPPADGSSSGGSSGGSDSGSDSGGSESSTGGGEAQSCQAKPFVDLSDLQRTQNGGPHPAPQPIDDLQDDDDPMAGGFIPTPDGGGVTFECDPFAQDCPAGEKCMPWANDGGPSWNATRCSPIAADPNQIGEPCMVEGSGVSGIDDCDIGAMCWNVDDNLMGTCIEMCSGSAVAPVCNTTGTVCVITNDGALTICQALCNPLAGECASDEGCYLVNELTVCAPDASGEMGGAGDPCEFINACDDGLSCIGAGAVPDCNSTGCCSPFCTIGDDSQCLPGQTCQPLYERGQAPLECVAELGTCAS